MQNSHCSGGKGVMGLSLLRTRASLGSMGFVSATRAFVQELVTFGAASVQLPTDAEHLPVGVVKLRVGTPAAVSRTGVVPQSIGGTGLRRVGVPPKTDGTDWAGPRGRFSPNVVLACALLKRSV